MGRSHNWSHFKSIWSLTVNASFIEEDADEDVTEFWSLLHSGCCARKRLRLQVALLVESKEVWPWLTAFFMLSKLSDKEGIRFHRINGFSLMSCLSKFFSWVLFQTLISALPRHLHAIYRRVQVGTQFYFNWRACTKTSKGLIIVPSDASHGEFGVSMQYRRIFQISDIRHVPIHGSSHDHEDKIWSLPGMTWGCQSHQ